MQLHTNESISSIFPVIATVHTFKTEFIPSPLPEQTTSPLLSATGKVINITSLQIISQSISKHLFHPSILIQKQVFKPFDYFSGP